MGNVDQTVLMAAAIITALALVALVVGTLALVRASNISRRFSWVSGKEGGIETLPALLRAMEAGQNDIAALKAAFDAAAIEGRTHFKRMGIVRYNAFEGVAGQQSYSLCLLDENRNGILISNLVGTNFSRSYAVEVKAGEASRPLGDEESQALQAATKNGN